MSNVDPFERTGDIFCLLQAKLVVPEKQKKPSLDVQTADPEETGSQPASPEGSLEEEGLSPTGGFN